MSYIFEFFRKGFKKPKQEDMPEKIENIYLQRLEKMKKVNESPKEKFVILDNIFRAYLINHSKIKKNENYENIYLKLKKNGELGLADFCKEMEYHFYGDVKIEKNNINSLISKFESLINHRDLTIDKKHRIQKKSQNKYLEITEKIKNSNKDPKENFFMLDKIIRIYLVNILKINKKDSYENIYLKLKKNGELGLADFCKEMEYYFYGDVKIEKNNIVYLANKFESLVSPGMQSIVSKKQEIEKKINKKIKKEAGTKIRIQKIKPKLLLTQPLVKHENITTIKSEKPKGFFKRFFSTDKPDSREQGIKEFRKLWHSEDE